MMIVLTIWVCLCVLTISETMILLYTEFLIEYYEYSFDYLITITNHFTINATVMVCSLLDTDLQNFAK